MTPPLLVATASIALVSIALALTWSYHRRRGTGDQNLLSACLNLAFFAGIIAVSFGLQGVPLPSSVRGVLGLILIVGALAAAFRAGSEYLKWARPRDRRELQEIQARRQFKNEGPDIERLP
ncbi:hypothetical protein ACLQ3K_24680 [Tsukamurella sp. DT100]|uniref:hypothetical protein n=1 Tax=Tsukamurella sp. DT100 TaxID=3393415 RepID=UPI003CFAA342